MAAVAVSSEYPIEGDAIVRGDPLTIQADIHLLGVPQDISGWEWRSHVRRSANATYLMEFDIEAVEDPDTGIVSRLLMSLDEEQTRQLKTGYVFDLEQVSPTHRTWWICKKLKIQADVSKDA